MTPCQRYRKQLRAYTDNELNSTEKKEIDIHLQECPDCGCHYQEIRSLRHALKNLTPIATEDNFHILLRERLRREMAGKKRQSVPVLRWAPAFASAIVIFAGGFWLSKMQDHSVEERPTLANTVTEEHPPVSTQPSEVQYVIDDLKEDTPPLIAVRSDQNTSSQDTAARQNLRHIKRYVQTVSF